MNEFSNIEIVDYDGLDLIVGKSGVWTTSKGMQILWETGKSNIDEHIRKVLKDEEINKKECIISGNEIVNLTGKTCQIPFMNQRGRKPLFYNQKVIIAVGLKVNSPKAIAFRKEVNDIIEGHLLGKPPELPDPSETHLRNLLKWENEGKSENWISSRDKTVINNRGLRKKLKEFKLSPRMFSIIADCLNKPIIKSTAKIYRKKENMNTTPLRNHLNNIELRAFENAESILLERLENIKYMSFETLKQEAFKAGRVANKMNSVLLDNYTVPEKVENNIMVN